MGKSYERWKVVGGNMTRKHGYKRRHRQIERLIRYYLRVRLMECAKDGRWVTIDEFWQEYFDELRESEV